MTATEHSGETPFPGLRPFEMLESHLFFGREGQVDVLAERLTRSRFVAVVGSSGSGKSSLVRAGLLPALYGGSLSEAGSLWKVALFRPGDDPIGNLAAAIDGPSTPEGNGEDPLLAQTTLRRSSRGLAQAWRETDRSEGENLLVVVDQFEELFRVSRSPSREQAGEDAAAFVRLLLESVGQPDLSLYVLITMRSDFLGHCSRFRDLPEALSQSQYLIPRMTRDQLRSAITGPVAVGGAGITPRLVQRVLNDIGDDQDQLPVLQHALMRTWRRWAQAGEDRPLDLDDYEAIGGLERALSLDAEEAFAELPTERSRDVARRLFQAITERAATQSETRRPTRLDEICAMSDATPVEVIQVIEAFRGGGRAFLMPPRPEPLGADSIVDISHESLIRQWARLRQWVAEETESRATYLRLVDAARLRQEGKGGLRRHPELGLELKWWRESGPNRAWARRYTSEPDQGGPAPFDGVRTFLGESEQARRREEQSRVRWFYVTVGGLGVLAVTFFVLFLWAWGMQNKAREQASLALARQLAAQSQQLRNDAPARLDLSVLLAVESLQRAPDQSLWREGGQALENGLRLLWREAWHLPEEATRRPASSIDLAPSLDRKYLAATVASDKGPAASGWITEMASGREVARFVPTDEDVRRWSESSGRKLAFSADGRYLTTGVRVYETATGRSVAALEQPGRLQAVDFGGTSLVATGAEDRTSRVFEATTGRELLRLMHGAPVAAVAFSPGGRSLVTGSWDEKARVFEMPTGRLVAELGHQKEVEAVAWSPDGRLVATGSRDQQARVFDATSGVQVARLGHQGYVVAVAFSPDGRSVATASTDHTARILDVTTSAEVARLTHQGAVTAVDWSPDGRLVITGSRDDTARVFEPTTGAEVARLGHNGAVVAAAFGPEGRRVATASRDNGDRWAIRAFDAVRYGTLARWSLGLPVAALTLSADGRSIAAVDRDGVPRVFEVAGEREVARLDRSGRLTEPVALSADGRLLAAGRRGGPAAVWDVPGGRELIRLPKSSPPRTLAFSPNGQYLATGQGVFAVTNGDLVASLEAGARVWAIAFSRDGLRLAVGDQDGVARVLEMPSGKEIRRIALKRPVRAVALSRDGRRLATGTDDWTGRVFDVASGKPLGAFEHRGLVAGGPLSPDAHLGIAVSPDGRLLATLGPDGKIRVHDVNSAQTVADFPHQARDLIASMDFASDGQQLLAAWTTGRNELVLERDDLERKRLIAEACARVGRNLSASEWEQYLPREAHRKTCPNLD